MVNTSSPEGGIGGHRRPGAAPWVEGADGFVEQERLRLAAQRRRRDRWRHEHRLDEVSLASVLRAAVGQQVSVHTASGAVAHGVVAEVGDEVVELARSGVGAPGARWFALGALRAVQVAGEPGGEPAAAGGRTLAELVEDLRGEEVVVGLTTGGSLTGVVVGNGRVVTLRAADGSHAVVARDAIESIAR